METDQARKSSDQPEAMALQSDDDGVPVVRERELQVSAMPDYSEGLGWFAKRATAVGGSGRESRATGQALVILL
jgi:hypothetical protein